MEDLEPASLGAPLDANGVTAPVETDEVCWQHSLVDVEKSREKKEKAVEEESSYVSHGQSRR